MADGGVNSNDSGLTVETAEEEREEREESREEEGEEIEEEEIEEEEMVEEGAKGSESSPEDVKAALTSASIFLLIFRGFFSSQARERL